MNNAIRLPESKQRKNPEDNKNRAARKAFFLKYLHKAYSDCGKEIFINRCIQFVDGGCQVLSNLRGVNKCLKGLVDLTLSEVIKTQHTTLRGFEVFNYPSWTHFYFTPAINMAFLFYYHSLRNLNEESCAAYKILFEQYLDKDHKTFFTLNNISKTS